MLHTVNDRNGRLAQSGGLSQPGCRKAIRRLDGAGIARASL